MRRRSAFATLLALLLLVAPSFAEDRVSLTPLVVDGVPLDANPPWQQLGTPVPVGAAETLVRSADGPVVRELTPELHVWLGDARLRVSVRVAEPPGPGMGLDLMVCDEACTSAADALAIGYAPQDVRTPRFVVRGLRGHGRGVYRVEGEVDLSNPDTWSAELRVPLADLGVAAGTPLRLAVVVRTRLPARIAWAPPTAAFRGPSAWFRLDPPVGGWPLEGALPAPDTLAAEDEQDRRRVQAWQDFLLADQVSWEGLVGASGVGGAGREEQVEGVRSLLVDPLLTVSELRPDLVHAHVVRGHVLALLHDMEGAEDAFRTARALSPGFLEARYGLGFTVVARMLSSRSPGHATDYDEALARAAHTAEQSDDPYVRDGVSYARGLLLYRRGAFDEAAAVLRPLAALYPFSQEVVFAAERAERAPRAWMRELRYREQEARRDDLPRVVLKTTKGDLLLDLFEDDAPNTVRNFVWLAQHGHFDNVEVGTVPFFTVRVEPTDPGYRIPTELASSGTGLPAAAREELRRRRAFRGALLMLAATRDEEAASFAILSGTALHLEGEFDAFGRVVEGLEILDALEAEDRILGVTIDRTRPGTTYHPRTVGGRAAPAPR